MTHRRSDFRRAILLGSTASVVASFAIGLSAERSFAQVQQQAQQQADAASDLQLEEIVVTGSRIARAGFDTLQPAVNLQSEFIDQRGFSNVADALNEVPAFGIPVDNQGGQSSQNLGQNFANAFGLGSQRTLTLINGRRTVGQNTPTSVGTAASGGLQVDLNIIPTALIERVETIFIGGAPIYGTDAVAGTVNIILKDDFEGLTADAQYGIDQRGDAQNFRVRGLWGANTPDGRGNVTLAAEYSTVRKVDARDNEIAARQFGFCESSVVAPENPETFSPCEDGANVWQVPNSGAPLLGNFVSQVPDEDGNAVNLGGTSLSTALNGSTGGNLRNANGDTLIFDAAGNLITAEEAGLGTPRTIFFSVGADGFNNPLVIGLDETNTLISPLDRWMLNGTASYEVADNTRMFLEGLYARSESTDTNNQPPWATAFFRGQAQGELLIDIEDNPFVTDQMRDTLNANWDRLEAIEQERIAEWNAANPDNQLEFQPLDRSTFRVTRSGIDLVQGAPNFRDQDVFRFVAGFDGDFEVFGNSWRWDTAFNFGETNAVTRQAELNRVRHALALDAVIDDRLVEDPEAENFGEPVNPETFGQAVCRSQLEGVPNQFETVFDTSANPTQRDIEGCFPLNPFGLNDLTEEERNYLVQQNFQATKIRQLTYEANIAGDLAELPAGPISLAGGFMHRREQGRFVNDAASETAAINMDAPLVNSRGKFNTTEFYGETLIPIIDQGEGLPFDVTFIDSLQLEGALRFVDNNRAGNDVTWTAGGRLRPNLPLIGSDLTIRGNFTQSIRAPSIPELFQPEATVNTFANDPCDPRFIDSGPNPSLRRQNCEQQVQNLKDAGALPDSFTLDNFTSLIVNRSDLATQGGNTDLDNEKADSWTVGGVFAPSFLPGFEMTVDWTSIQLNGAITTLTATQLLNACFDSTDFPDNQACQAFERDSEFQVRNPRLNFLNAAVRDFSGLVANVAYSFDATDLPFLPDNAPGSFRLFGNFFHVANHEQEVAGGDLDILDGERFNEKLQFQINLQYDFDRFSMLWQTRHIGSHIVDRQAAEDLRSVDKIPGVRFHNLTLSYQITDSIRIQSVVNNILDERDGPLRGANTGGNNLNFTDVIGRRFLFSVNASF